MTLWLEILGKAATGDDEAVRELRFTLLQEIRYAPIFDTTRPYTNPIEKMIYFFAVGRDDSERGMILSRQDDFADYVADQVFVEGEDITEFDDVELARVRKKIGMVFQEGALFPDPIFFRTRASSTSSNSVMSSPSTNT